MSTWVLVILFAASEYNVKSGVAIEKIEGFKSKSACMESAKVLANEFDKSFWLQSICIEKK